jgi:DNA-binding NarL/FixJ family response regulator
VIRLLIVDDQSLIRESLELLLHGRGDIEVVATAKSGEEAISLALETRPDVILMDVRLPGMDGVSAMAEIRRGLPEAQVIILSTFDNDEFVFRALRNGARGYLLKSIPIAELVESIHKVHAGEALMNPEVTAKVFAHFAREASPPDDLPPAPEPSAEKTEPPRLNRSEEAIVELIAQGFSNKEITVRLSLSEGTVRNYISSILLKTGLRDRTQVAIWAVHRKGGAS